MPDPTPTSQNALWRTLIPKLYEDDLFVVFDKPPGLLVIPTPKNERHTMVDIVNVQNPSGQGDRKLHPCHRLDRDTSGAILFAKGKRAQKLMMDLFRQRVVSKKYIAFIQGKLQAKTGELKSRVKGLEKRTFRKHSPGQWALTRYRVLRDFRNFCVVEAEPVTGRTNQIRIQFSDLGHPLVGERKYAFGRDAVLKFRRTALHAHFLEWKHPVTRKTIKATSNLPKDMEAFLERNRN